MTMAAEWGDEPVKVVDTVYRFKRATEARWLQVDPILALSEPGHETDTGKMKLGNGISRWSELPYTVGELPQGGPVSMEDLEDHVNSETPHPVYDDGPSFMLLYQNAKV